MLNINDIAKVVEATREAPENIGTAFKTIIARMQQVKEAGVIVEDGVTTPLNKVQEALEAVGVELLDHEGQLRDLQDVFRDLGAEWDYMDRNTKAYLATILAGSRQQSRFLALMNDFNRTNELVAISQLSAGEASKQFQTHLTGIEASLARLKAAQEEFLMGLLNQEHYKGAIDSLRTLLDMFSGIPPIMTLAIAGITGWIAKTIISIGAAQAKTVAQQIQNAATQQSARASQQAVAGLTAEELSIYKVVAALHLKTAAMKSSIAVSLKMHAATLGITLLIGAAIYAVMRLVLWIGKLTSARKLELEQLRESIGDKQERITVLERERDELSNLAKEHDELRNKVSRTVDEERRLEELNRRLASTYGELVVGVDSFGNVILDTTKYVEEKTKAIQKQNLALLENRLLLAEQEFETDYVDTFKEIAALQREIQIITGDSDPLLRGRLPELGRAEDIQRKINALEIQQNDLIKERYDLQQRILVQSTTLKQDLDAASTILANLVAESIPKIDITLDMSPDEMQAAFAEHAQQVQDQLEASFKDGVPESFQGILRDYGEGIVDSLGQGLDVANILEYIHKFEQEVSNLLDIDVGQLDLTQFIIAPNIEAIKPIVDFEKRIASIGETTEEFETKLQNLRDTSVTVYAGMARSLNQYTKELQASTAYQALDVVKQEEHINRHLGKRIDLFNELNKVINEANLEEGMRRANEYLDAGNIALYNQEITNLIDGVEGLDTALREAFLDLYLVSEEIPKTLNDAVGSIKKTGDAIKELSSALDTLREGQDLTFDQIMNLVEAHQELIYHLRVKNGILVLEQEGIEAVKNARIEAFKDEMRNHKTSLQAQLVRIETEIALMEAVLEGEMTMKEANASLDASITNIEAAVEAAAKNMGSDFQATGEEAVHAAREADKAWRIFYENRKREARDEESLPIAAYTKLAVRTAARASADTVDIHQAQAELHNLREQRERDRAEAKKRLELLRSQAETITNQIEVLAELVDADIVASIKAGQDAGSAAAKAIEEYVSILEDFYNIMRRIESIQFEIARIQSDRRFLETTEEIVESMGREIDATQRLYHEQERLLLAQRISLGAIGDIIRADYGDYVTISEDGILQLTDAYDKLGDEAKEKLDELIEDWREHNQMVHDSTIALDDLRISMMELGQSIVDLQADRLTEEFEKIKEKIDENINAIQEMRDEFFNTFDSMQSRADQFNFDQFEREINLVLDQLAMLEGRRFAIADPTLGESTLRQNVLNTQTMIVNKVDEMKQIQESVNEILDREINSREDIARNVEDLSVLLEQHRQIQHDLIAQEQALINRIAERQRVHAQIVHNLQQEIENRRRAHERLESALQREIDHYVRLNNSIKDAAFNIDALAQEIALLGVEHDINVDIGEVKVGEIPTDLLEIFNQVKGLASGINSDLDSQIALKKEIHELISDIESEMRNVTLQYQRQRKELVDQIEALKQAESERHKFVSDLLDKELKKYEAIIQAKLKLLEEERAEQQYQEKLFEEEQERARIMAELDVLGLDDSHEARARFLDLQQQLADQEHELNKMHDERTHELRKSNLEQQLDNIRAYIDALRERNDIIAEENDRHLELLEEQLEELDAAYNKEIAILNLFVNHVRDVYQDLNTAIQENISALQDNLARKREIHQQEIAAMQENLQRQQELHRIEIEQLQAKLRGIQELMRFNAHQMRDIFQAQQDMWEDNMKAEHEILKQKLRNLENFVTAYLKLLALGGIDRAQFAHMVGQIVTGGSLTRGQASGSAATDANKALQDQEYAKSEFWRAAQVALHEDTTDSGASAAIRYMKSIPQYSGLTLNELERLITDDELKRLKAMGYGTGGYTGTFQGGKIGILHQKELVLNPADTENILEAVGLVREAAATISGSAQQVSGGTATSQDLHITVNIDKVMGDREGARLVAKETSKEVLIAFRKFGGQTA